MDNTCCKCGKNLNGCIVFTGVGDMCGNCYGKYILKEVLKDKKKHPIKINYPISEELQKKGI